MAQPAVISLRRARYNAGMEKKAVIQGVSELALWVSDLDRSVAFYRDRLGFELYDLQAGQHAFLRSGTLILGLFNKENPGTPLAEEYLQRTGGARGDVYHVGFLVERDSLDQFGDELRGQGLAVKGPVDFATGRRSYFVEDPDEHYIELTDR